MDDERWEEEKRGKKADGLLAQREDFLYQTGRKINKQNIW